MPLDLRPEGVGTEDVRFRLAVQLGNLDDLPPGMKEDVLGRDAGALEAPVTLTVPPVALYQAAFATTTKIDTIPGLTRRRQQEYSSASEESLTTNDTFAPPSALRAAPSGTGYAPRRYRESRLPRRACQKKQQRGFHLKLGDPWSKNGVRRN